MASKEDIARRAVSTRGEDLNFFERLRIVGSSVFGGGGEDNLFQMTLQEKNKMLAEEEAARAKKAAEEAARNAFATSDALQNVSFGGILSSSQKPTTSSASRNENSTKPILSLFQAASSGRSAFGDLGATLEAFSR